MTTKVEPTVEKWEKWISEVAHEIYIDAVGDPNDIFYDYEHPRIIKILKKFHAQSVQEAKAERDELWNRAWIMYFFEKGDVPAKEAREIIKKYANFFEKSLASLKQEEGK